MSPPRPQILPSLIPVQQAYQADLVQEVADAVASEKVVVVGVAWLGPGRRARAMLDAEQIPYRYLEYGSYLAGWRRRLALKIWVGWPTFPLIFANGTFIGGATDLKKLLESGELKKMLALPR